MKFHKLKSKTRLCNYIKLSLIMIFLIIELLAWNFTSVNRNIWLCNYIKIYYKNTFIFPSLFSSRLQFYNFPFRTNFVKLTPFQTNFIHKMSSKSNNPLSAFAPRQLRPRPINNVRRCFKWSLFYRLYFVLY